MVFEFWSCGLILRYRIEVLWAAEERRKLQRQQQLTTDFTDFERRNDADTATPTAKSFVRTYRVKIAAAYRLGRSSGFAVAVSKAPAVDVSVSFSPFKIRKIRGKAVAGDVEVSTAVCANSAPRLRAS